VIQRLSHVTIYVDDQDVAFDFYVNKLGFEVRTDNRMEGFRWLTVGPKGQPDLEIVLMPLGNPMMKPEVAGMLKTLVKEGALGAGVMETGDVQKTYDDLVAKGVEFTQPPTDRFYGIEALMKDPFGNWFSVTQRKPH